MFVIGFFSALMLIAIADRIFHHTPTVTDGYFGTGEYDAGYDHSSKGVDI
jgi:hypothetical protein